MKTQQHSYQIYADLLVAASFSQSECLALNEMQTYVLGLKIIADIEVKAIAFANEPQSIQKPMMSAAKALDAVKSLTEDQKYDLRKRIQ